MKNKDKAIGMDVSDSKTLHSLQVAKLSSHVSLSSQVKQNCIFPINMNAQCKIVQII